MVSVDIQRIISKLKIRLCRKSLGLIGLLLLLLLLLLLCVNHFTLLTLECTHIKLSYS
jgi:hypothetical protein